MSELRQHDPDAVKESPAHSKKADENRFPFSITVGCVYDGPLDLLLDLVRKQDIDIYDIPIGTITAQFLGYIERMKQTDVNVAAEFIYIASLLIHIKSKMLLPRDPEHSGHPEEDPRDELVRKLLDHERFKAAGQLLLQKQQLEESVLTNPAIREFRDAEGTEPELAADVMDLVRTSPDVIERLKSRPVLQMDEDTVTVRPDDRLYAAKASAGGPACT